MIKKLTRKAISLGMLAFASYTMAPNAIAQDENVMDYLPSINELYSIASKMELSNGWSGVITIESKNYDAMRDAERAFEAGTTLSDIAFVISTLEDDKTPSDEVLSEANSAILALDSSLEMKRRLERMKKLIDSNKLDGETLREELDTLISEVFPQLREKPDVKDQANLALAAATFKVMYLGAGSVASIESPSTQQLAMFRWSAIADYFIGYFSEHAQENFASQTEVNLMTSALTSIRPLLAKAPDKMTKTDVIAIRDALAQIYG